MHIADDVGAAERVTGAYVSANTFGLLGSEPAIGRDFRVEDDRPGAEPVVLLGYRVWQRRYGGDAGVIGRSIRVNGAASTVIGVMPERFGFALQLAVGLAIGLGGAFALGQVLQGVLAGVSGRDPATLAAVPALFVAVAFLACLIPARRAMRLSPVDARRAD